MKIKFLTSLLISSFILIGCGSDDVTEPPVVVPPVVVPPVVVPPVVSDAVDIDQATGIVMSLSSFDAATGALTFTLSNDENKAIIKASNYHIAYFGYPDPVSPSTNPKAWKRWHVTQSFKCDIGSDDECAGELTETANEGEYAFYAADLDLDSKAAAGELALYKVAIEIHGAQASNDIELMTADE